MKYIKLFEEINNDVAKKFPHLFNLFVDHRYIKEGDYEIVNELLSSEDDQISTPFYSNGSLWDVADVEDEVELSDEDIKNIPINFKVRSNLYLSNAQTLKSLPHGLEAMNDLDISDTAIEFLPDNLKVGGDLYIMDCYNIKSLPNGLEVGYDLKLNGSINLKTLPQDLKVGGDLYLEDSGIKELPPNFEVGGKIYW